MRFLRATLLAALALAAYGVLQAFLSARELEVLPPTTTRPNLPVSGFVGLLGFAVSLGVYGLLGRSIARSGGTPGAAAARGAIAGLLAGALSGTAQALLSRDFVLSLALAYGFPDAFANLVLIAILVASPLVGAGIGALITWLAALLLRPSRAEELV